jgi:hypothetical protein
MDDLPRMREVAEWACFSTYAFCHSLRGYEVVKAVSTDLRGQIERNGPHPHVGLPLRGRFKICGNAQVAMLCFISATTASGLKPLEWTDRLLGILDRVGATSDWLFHTSDAAQRSMSSFEEQFLEQLLEIQALRNSPIDENLDVIEEYHLARSFRRGATTHAQNQGVSQPDINWINRWGTGKEQVITGPMLVVYPEKKQMIRTFLRFSRAL